MLVVNNVSKILKKNPILKNVSFTINEGDLVGFVGDNGAGKTTTIKCIFNEFKIDSGKITYQGKPLQGTEILRDIFFFADSNNIPLNLSVRKYIMYTAYHLGLDKQQIEQRIESICKSLNLSEHLKKHISELSAGMKKRAILASALVCGPKIIFLDEPTANLDVESKLELINLLKDLHKKGVTIFITSHIIEELQGMINKLIIIKKGEIVYNNVFDNKKEQIINIYKKYTNNKTIDSSVLNDIYADKGENNEK
ncbi:ABC transporter ATP-binding protein [Spiroplasma endosymbiont of Amphibalanus improvisus]|uniref:ABC transporter ATP-binding protein n=1 Tax=Spiroplasma endosymbiont of Amphibalanus improvisus TaxID=3066327 RepID=UPI00313D1E1F